MGMLWNKANNRPTLIIFWLIESESEFDHWTVVQIEHWSSALLGDGSALLSCSNVVRKLQKPEPGQTWEVKLAPGSNIPFITDGTTKQWCMELFQDAEESQAEAALGPPQLDLGKITNSAPAEGSAAEQMVPLQAPADPSQESAGIANVGNVKTQWVMD